MADLTDAELDRLVEQLGAIIPLLDGLETGQDCADYAFAKSNGFQAMTYCPDAFEALRSVPEAAAAITALRARIAEDQAQIAALTTYRENLRDEVIELRARIAELEARLEIDPAYPYDGIAARDATIEGLQGQIAELEAERAEWVEVERLRMGKTTPPTPPA